MAKKKRLIPKPRNKVVVKVTGAALPSSLCLSAGHAIGTVEERLSHLNYELTSGSKPSEIQNSIQNVAWGLGMIAAQFPLTEKTLKPLREKFYSRTLKGEALRTAILEAQVEMGDLKHKAKQGCQ
jgi:hypothetical protein